MRRRASIPLPALLRNVIAATNPIAPPLQDARMLIALAGKYESTPKACDGVTDITWFILLKHHLSFGEPSPNYTHESSRFGG